MTYNFDPDQWYDRERAVLERRLQSGALDAAGFKAAVADLVLRYETMCARLDGTYQLPVSGSGRQGVCRADQVRKR